MTTLAATAPGRMLRRSREKTGPPWDPWQAVKDLYATFLGFLHAACDPNGMERWVAARQGLELDPA